MEIWTFDIVRITLTISNQVWVILFFLIHFLKKNNPFLHEFIKKCINFSMFVSKMK